MTKQPIDELPSNTIRERKRSATVPMREEEVSADTDVVKSEEDKFANKPQVQARIRKKPFLSRMKEALFGEDTRQVADYILWDVLLPAAKDTIQDVVTKGIERALFGEARPSGRSRSRSGIRGTSGTVVSYNQYYRSSRRNDSRAISTKELHATNVGPRVEDVIFDYQEEAQEVIEFMIELVDTYGAATVSDYYDVAGVANFTEYTDNNVGWTRREDFIRAKIVKGRAGWQIILPQPILL